ncbi:MAG: hypothetical protein VYE18_05050, partial [Pseudomonadota bacterium]|nr:hypothetical protein [Pseudomonadota bacterium]
MSIVQQFFGIANSSKNEKQPEINPIGVAPLCPCRLWWAMQDNLEKNKADVLTIETDIMLRGTVSKYHEIS